MKKEFYKNQLIFASAYIYRCICEDSELAIFAEVLIFDTKREDYHTNYDNLFALSQTNNDFEYAIFPAKWPEKEKIIPDEDGGL